MTSHTAYIVILLWFKTIHCNDSLVKPVINISYDFQCQEKTCILKCCPEEYLVKGLRKSCVHYLDNSLDFSDLEVYDADIKKVVSTVKEGMRLIPGMFNNETFKHEALDLSNMNTFNVYLTEDGELYIESPNSFKRWIKGDKNQFCVDYRLNREQGPRPSPTIWVLINEVTQEPSAKPVFSAYVLLVTCFFLLLVLIIYPLVPTNRTINGVIQLLSILSLFKVFVLLFVMYMRSMMEEECLRITYSIYFFYISSFSWMNVTAFDIWRTFRNQARPPSRINGIQLFLYCLYAWGVPLVMTFDLIMINYLDLRYMPWIIQPQVPQHGCFLDGGEKVLYMYVPSLILLLICVIIYTMTAQKILRPKRGNTGIQNHSVISAEFYLQWQRFMVNVALLAAMLLHCSLEIASLLGYSISLVYFVAIYGVVFGPLLCFILLVYPRILSRKALRRQENDGLISTKSHQPLHFLDKAQSA